MRYAVNTHVSVDRSKAEIEKILTRYGAEQFMAGWQEGRAVIAFVVNSRVIQFDLPLPDKNADEFRLTPTGRHKRSEHDAYKAWEQACRQRWRALANGIKAKLEFVECQVATFEEEFLAYIVLPNGKGTVGKWFLPQIAQAYSSGKMPKLLPSG